MLKKAPTGNPSKTKQVRYKTSLVTYLDILGFRRLLQIKTAAEISKILRIFKTAARQDEKTEVDFDRLYEHFSDLTVRSISVSSCEYLLVRPALLQYELESIAKIQIALLWYHDILIRGGIAIGALVKSWGLIYGDGLVAAYELESKATHPRVLIQDTLIHVAEKLEEQDRGFSIGNLIAKEGSVGFVDYLWFSTTNFDDHEDLLDFLAKHKLVIESGLKKFATSPRTLAKFRWLKRYHNSTIQRLGEMFVQEGLLVG